MDARREDQHSVPSLLLSTWFIMCLTRQAHGGLPNDILTRGAAALLLFEHIDCDAEALASEKSFAGIWLSSDLLVELEREGILRPMKLRYYLPRRILDELESEGIAQQARDIMEKMRRSLAKDSRASDTSRLPPRLTALNHYLFSRITVPRTLRYEWQENHFLPGHARWRELSAVRERAFGRPDESQSPLESLASELVPGFQLIPPLPREAGRARAAFAEVLRKEKRNLYRWICGDPSMTQHDYQEFRKGRDFRALDLQIDEARKNEAFKNLQTLLDVRRKTKSMRRDIQRLTADVLEGRKQLDEAKADIQLQVAELSTYVASTKRTKFDVALAGVSLLLGRAGHIAPTSTLAQLVGQASTLVADYAAYDAVRSKQQIDDSRALYPYAWFVREYEAVRFNRRGKARGDLSGPH
jgi:hypothetical protein